MQKFWKIFLFIFLIGFQADFVLVLENSKVIINEICWMGTKNSANDEWLELYNETEKSLNLEGWILKAEDGSPEIKLSGKIPAHGFYLLERTDDNTLPGITADQIYKGALENNGENLKLYDNFGNLIDEANCQDSWLAGDNKTKQTMERKEDDSWQNSQEPGGTPKAENSKGITIEKEITTESNKMKEVQPPPSIKNSNLAALAALITSFASAVIVFFLKRKLRTF